MMPTRARYRIYTLAEFLEAPKSVLQEMIDSLAGHRAGVIDALPDMPDLTGLNLFLQDLKNQGMHPFLAGNIPDRLAPNAPAKDTPKTYVIR